MIDTRRGGRALAVTVLVACGSSSTTPPPAEARSSASLGACATVEALRPALYTEARKELDHLDWTKAQAAELKHKAAEATVSAIVSKCVEDHWSRGVIACLAAGAMHDGASKSACGPKEDELLSNLFDDVEDTTFTRFFGPRPRDALEEFGEQQERLAAAKAAAKAARATAIEPRAIIPAHHMGIAWFGNPGAPLFVFARTLSKSPAACIDQVLSTVEGYYQTGDPGSAPSLIAVRGTIDRTAAEACVREVVAAVAPDVQLERDGAITRIRALGGSSYLGWASDGTVYSSNSDRAAVEEALAQKTTIASNAVVMALVNRVDRSKHTWAVIAADFTSKLIGVPSTGILFASDLFATPRTGASPAHLPLTIELASAGDAKRAVAAIRAPHPALSTGLQQLLGQLSPIAHDRDIEIDIAPVFLHAELMDEMTKLFAQLAGPKP